MIEMLRIVVAGTLLYGATQLTAPVQAAAPGRVLPRAPHAVKADPCRPSWPDLIRTCLA